MILTFHKKNEKRITDIGREFTNKTGIKVEIEIKFFDIDLEEAIFRDAQREQPVGSNKSNDACYPSW